MPKMKKGIMEKSMDMLSGLIQMHQKMEDISNASMAKMIRPGMHEKTFRKKTLDPATFTVGELAITMRRLHFTEDEAVGVIRLMLMKEDR